MFFGIGKRDYVYENNRTKLICETLTKHGVNISLGSIYSVKGQIGQVVDAVNEIIEVIKEEKND